MDIIKHNSKAWDNYVDKNDKWTIPVSVEDLQNAENELWSVLLTPTKPVPLSWFPDLKNLKLLGLACGGGQQGPLFATLGADVTIFDNSEKQLLQDKKISDSFNLGIQTVKGNMKDLSVFENETFDLIFNPCSLLFIDDVKPVWKECFRVLKPKGILMSGLINPLSFQIENETLLLKYKQPYSDIDSLPEFKLDKLVANNEALEFGHSLTDLIGEQLNAGFALTDFYEDNWNGENNFDLYFPSFFATRAVKIMF